MNETDKTHLHIYTDGACKGNPGRGAWGFIVMDNEGEILHSDTGYSEHTTNNRMELLAMMEALQYVISLNKEWIFSMYTDSTYTENICDSWLESWVSRGILKQKCNYDLTKQLWELLVSIKKNKLDVSYIKVKGHSGVRGNELVDHLVNQTIEVNYGIGSNKTSGRRTLPKIQNSTD